jgi:hypothetical protein
VVHTPSFSGEECARIREYYEENPKYRLYYQKLDLSADQGGMDLSGGLAWLDLTSSHRVLLGIEHGLEVCYRRRIRGFYIREKGEV